MKSADPRDFGLNAVQCEQVRSSLLPDEQLRWAGRPVVRWSNDTDTMSSIFGCFFFAPFGLGGAGMMYLLLIGQFNGGVMEKILVGLISLIFMLVPVCVLIVRPLWHASDLRRTAYAITNRRAIVCGGEGESWPLAPGMVISNQQAKDGCGNLVFSLRPNEDHPGWEEFGFMDIRDVRLVEELLEKAIAERENA